MTSRYPAFLQLDIADTGHRFFVWWRAELTALIPSRIRRAFGSDPRRLTLATTGTEWQVFPEADLPGASQAEKLPLVRGSWENVEETFLSEQGRWRSLLTASIRVPASACLDRAKELPTASLRNAGDVLLLDMESRTPFRRNEVYWDWYLSTTDTSAEHAQVHQIILKRTRIAQAVERLGTLGIHLSTIEVEREDGTKLPVNLWPRETRRSPVEIGLRRAAMGSFLIALLATASIAGIALYRQEQTLDRLQAEKKDLAEKASAIRKRMAEVESTRSQLMQVRLRKAQAPRVVEIWEEISLLLPATAWVTDFKYDTDVVTIDVLAPSASELVGIFAKSPLFREVAFASTVTHDAQRNLERVQIRMRAAETAASGDSSRS